MVNYYRIILGRKNSIAPQCVAEGFVGIDYDVPDLAPWLDETDDDLYARIEETYRKQFPDASQIRVSLACGVILKFSRRIRIGDIVVCPMGDATYRAAAVTTDYRYVAEGPLPHRRGVQWLPQVLEKSKMSDALRGGLGGALTIIGPDAITRHREEIKALLDESAVNRSEIVSSDPSVEDPFEFAMERHLEDFLIRNWSQIPLGQEFDVYEEAGEQVGQQFPTAVGPIDILAISKDQKRLLVIELKRGRASDVVIGQLARYMGFVKSKIAEPHQTVEGAVIALTDDDKLQYAMSAFSGVRFYRYQVDFRLIER